MPARSMPRREFLTLLGGAAAAGSAALLPTGLGRYLHPRDALALPANLRGASAFPFDEAMAGRLLAAARSRGADFADLYCETRTVSRLNLSEGGIESCEQGIFAGCGVRAIEGDRTGYAYADSFEEPPLVKAARDAAAIASSGNNGWGRSDLPFRRDPLPVTVRCLRSFDQVSLDERVSWLRRVDAAARAVNPAVKQVTIEYADEMLHFLVVNSDGVWAEDTLPNLYLRVNVIALKNGHQGAGMDRLSMRMGAEQIDADAPERAGREAARMALVMCDAEDAPAGEMPVVLGAGGGVIFHEAVGHGLEADAVYRGTSMFAGKIGERVGSEQVSVIDTGAIPDLRGSYNVDDEGEPPRRNLLIDRGILRGFLNDRMTALALRAPRTGNGRRQSYRFPPLVRMSNTFLAEGQDTPDEIIRSTRSGLFARALGGGEVDTTTGNFTFGILEAYRIENGRIGRPVRGATLVGSGPEIMKRIDRVAADQKFWNGTCGKGQWVPVTSGAPTLRVSAMTVGGSQSS